MSIKNSRRSFIKNTSLGVALSALQPSFGFNSLRTKENKIGHGDFQFSLDKVWGVQYLNYYSVDLCLEMVIDS